MAIVGFRLPIGPHIFEMAPKDVYEIVLQDVIEVSFNRICN